MKVSFADVIIFGGFACLVIAYRYLINGKRGNSDIGSFGVINSGGVEYIVNRGET